MQSLGERVASDGRDLLVRGTTGNDGRVFHFIPTCGDGVLDPCETCDDGNTAAGDGCDATCVLETCGDGVVDPGEQCDDGNDVDGDGCDRGCLATGCGNCVVTAGEECDDGNDATGDHCDPNCTLPRCGNGVVGRHETCDDANTLGGDGCSAACQAEACGNGVVDAGESCDDGNLAAGDGCDASCRLETARLAWWKSTFAFPGTYHGPPVIAPAGVVVVLDTGFDVTQAQLFDATTGALLHTFPEQSAARAAGFDGDIWIADIGAPGIVNRYDGTTLALRQSYRDPDPNGPYGFGAALGRAGTQLLVQNVHTVDVFDAATGAFLHSLSQPGATEPNFGSDIVAVGAHVALSGNAAAYLFDPASGAFLATLDGAPVNAFDFVHPVALGARVLIHAADGTVTVFDGGTGAPLHTIRPPAGPDPAFGRFIAGVGGALLISGGGAVHVFDPATYDFRRTIANPAEDDYCFGSTMLETPFGVAISDRCKGDDFNGIVYIFDEDGWRLVAALPDAHGGTDLRAHTRTLGIYGTTLLVAHETTHDPGAILAYRPCADGVLEPGEECDDDNLVSGDGCDLSCTVTRCGNGIVTAGEECDDGNRRAGDGCENDCTVTREVCPTPLRLDGAEVALRHLGEPRGNETLMFSGILVPPAGSALDPRDAAAHGAQVRILDADGAALLDLSLATALIPPGARGDACGRRDGWRRGKGRVIYTNRSGALDPQCTPGSAQGLRRLEIRRRAADGGLSFRLRVGPAAIADPVGALRVAIAFGGGADPAAACGARVFDDVACAASARGSTVVCR